MLILFLNHDYTEEDEKDELKGAHSQKVGRIGYQVVD